MATSFAPELVVLVVELAESLLALTSPEFGEFGDVIDALSQPEVWLGAAAGGAFGAAIGALPAFVFTGFLVIVGSFQQQTAAELGAAPAEVDPALAGVDIGFGPVFGPHISFAAGAAAAAYASKQGYMESGFDYHNGKDITFALGSKPDILLVGAVFGIVGLVIEQTFRMLAVPTDPIAFAVVASALIHRAAFGYSIVGVVSSKADGYFDMGPFEREEYREPDVVPGDGEKAGSDRLAVEPWLPNMYKWSHVTAIGLFAGLVGGWTALHTGNAFLGFGISAASLLFLNLGVERIPVTHHMTLPAATAYLAVRADGDALIAGQSEPVAVIFAGIFGVIGALVGEAFQRVFYAHGDTHVDPPAASIFIVHSLIALLVVLGVFATGDWVPGVQF